MFRFSRNQTTLDDLMLIDENINAFAGELGVTFSDPRLLQSALTHRSFVHENPAHPVATSERLEFLGDSVLSLVVTDELFKLHGALAEGELSKLRSFIVNEETLAQIARGLGVHRYVLVGRGEAPVIETKAAILADALEAILGAMYLDQGLEVVREKFTSWARDLNLFDSKHLIDFDAKSRLQEFCLKKWQELPSYVAEERKLPQGLSFLVTLKIRGRELVSTQNTSKKKAELWLAQTCLKHQLHLYL